MNKHQGVYSEPWKKSETVGEEGNVVADNIVLEEGEILFHGKRSTP